MAKTKRRADTELTMENYDEHDPGEAGVFAKANKESISQRAIKIAKRRSGSSGQVGSGVFSAFGGFVNTSSGQNPAQRQTAALSTSRGNSNSQSSDGANAGGAKRSRVVEASESGNVNEHESSVDNSAFLNALQKLNKSVIDFCQNHFKENPYIDLAPVFRDYERYFKAFEEKYGASGNNTGGVSAPTTAQCAVVPDTFSKDVWGTVSASLRANQTTAQNPKQLFLGRQPALDPWHKTPTTPSATFSDFSTSATAPSVTAAMPFVSTSIGSKSGKSVDAEHETQKKPAAFPAVKPFSPFKFDKTEQSNTAGKGVEASNTISSPAGLPIFFGAKDADPIKSSQSTVKKAAEFPSLNFGLAAGDTSRKIPVIPIPSVPSVSASGLFGSSALANSQSTEGTKSQDKPAQIVFGQSNQSLTGSLFPGTGVEKSATGASSLFSSGVKISPFSPPQSGDVEKPSAVGSTFSFGPKTSTPAVTAAPASSTAGFTFSAAAKAAISGSGSTAASASGSVNDNQEDEADQPPKVEITEFEEENCIFSTRCKLFKRKEEEWNEMGIGTLYLKTTEKDSVQLLVRAGTTLGNILMNVLLNETVLKSVKVKAKNVSLVCCPMPEDDGFSTILIRVKDAAVANDLYDKMREQNT